MNDEFPIELFNLRGETNPADPIPPNYSLKQAWIDFQSVNAKEGFRAIRYLAKHPESAIKLFQSKIQPTRIPGDRQIQIWIADLDDRDFDVRELAHRQLQQTGRRIRKPLNEALTNTTSAEVRQRLQRILQSFEEINVPHVVIERACEVLQWIESAEAKALLRKWAAGDPADHLTEEAIETLKTLDRLEKLDREQADNHSPAIPAPSR
ncbi:MAG: hypothetical protein U0798_08960 [Gemmataceae bacterium]